MKNFKINKNFNWCVFILLVCFPEFSFTASLTRQEQLEFIESLAKVSTEKRVFYRWQSKEDMKSLLEAGEYTEELYNYFMSRPLDPTRKKDLFNGPGLFAAQSIDSSQMYGDTLIQIEVEPGYKYLELNSSVGRQLAAKGIKSPATISNLNPGIGIRYFYDADWWVFRNRQGVRFKPFDSKNIKLDDLVKTHGSLYDKNRQFFTNAVKDDIVQRSVKDFSVFETPFVSLVEEERGREYVSNRINSQLNNQMSNIKNDTAIINKLKLWSPYLNRENRIKFLQQIPDESNSLRYILTELKGYLNLEDILEVFKTFPINSSLELIKENHKDIISTKALQEELINRAKNTPLSSYRDTAILLELGKNYMPNETFKKLISKTPIHSAQEAALFLRHSGHHFSFDDRTNIIKRTPIHSLNDVSLILDLEGSYLAMDNILDRTIPLIHSTEDLKTLKPLLNDKDDYQYVRKAFRAKKLKCLKESLKRALSLP